MIEGESIRGRKLRKWIIKLDEYLRERVGRRETECTEECYNGKLDTSAMTG